MPFVTLKTPMPWPGNTLPIVGAVPTIGGLDLLDGTNAGPGGGTDATAIIFTPPENMAVSHVFARCHAAVSSPNIDTRLETVDPLTGFPTNTPVAASANHAQVIATNMNVIALDAVANLVRGVRYTLAFRWVSGGSATMSTMAMGSANYYSNPYKATNIATGAWVKSAHAGLAVGLGPSATTMYCIPGLFPVSSSVAANAFTNSAGGRRGARFRVPYECYISGFRYLIGTAIGGFSAAIYDAAHAELNASLTTFDGKVTPELAQGCHNLFFDNEVGPLSTGVDYYLGIMPTEAVNCNLYTFTLLSGIYRNGFPGGTDFDYAAGTPNQVAVDTSVPMLDLLISRIPMAGTDPAPASGGGAHIIGI